MEAICVAENIEAALRAVVRNKGAPGVDGMTVRRAAGRPDGALAGDRETLLQGRYQPQPVRRVHDPEAGRRDSATSAYQPSLIG